MKCPICHEETIGEKDIRKWGPEFAHGRCVKAYSLGHTDGKRAALAETAEPEEAKPASEADLLVYRGIAERYHRDAAPQPPAPAQADMDTQAGELLKAFAGYHGPGVSGILRSAQPPAPAVGDGDLAIAYMAGYRAAKKAPAVELTDDMKTVLTFLLGEGPLDGTHFGDERAGANRYWWRKNLRAAIAAHEKKWGGAS